ncbi:MAG: hypothetical protein IT314_09185 [Anaerolineales bacterium]|nr:hypothetical protein [Anaerolineales bacterium]
MFKTCFLALLSLTLVACAPSVSPSTPTALPSPTNTLAPTVTETLEPTATHTVTPSPTVVPTSTPLPFPSYDEMVIELGENCKKMEGVDWIERANLSGEALAGIKVVVIDSTGHAGPYSDKFFNFAADANRLWCDVTGWGYGEVLRGEESPEIWGTWEFPVVVGYYNPDDPRAENGFVKYYYFPSNNQPTPSP